MKVLNVVIPIFFSTILVTANITSDKDLEEQWTTFKENYGKKYATSLEEQYRKEIFTYNYKIVIEQNKLFAKGEESYSMKINQFSDITESEMEKYMGLDDSDLEWLDKLQDVQIDIKSPVIPEKIDWRQFGAVTGVKTQGKCGSCWAFTTIGALEGQYYIKTGKLVSLSEQNLIDCSNITNNHGCEGGNPFKAYEYILINDGINSESAYPYKEKQENCRYSPSNNITSIRFFGKTKKGSEDSLKDAVATIGPIAALIYADLNFKSYDSGVYYSRYCHRNRHKIKRNHAGLVVGYGTTEEGLEYWIVKNSWGKSWGEDGYIRMARNRNNNCEIATFPSFPIMY